MANLTSGEAIERAKQFTSGPTRRLLGIVGPPGSGKSTLAVQVAEAVRGAVVVPMDGFHLPQDELRRRGRRDRMGAIDTFDVGGYRAVLRRLGDDDGRVVAPGFDRTIEEPVPGAIRVPARCRLVVTEGNYLLDAESPWPAIRHLLDEVWFIDVDERIRVDRLLTRHLEFGKTPAEAATWVRDVDQPNAERILARRAKADVIVRVDPR